MLTRLEVAYLATLRVVLLIAATIALLVTVGAAVTALPALVEMVGIAGHSPTRGGTLREFIESNRITDVEASKEDATEPVEKYPLPDDVAEASKAFARYDSRNGGVQLEQSKWDDIFRSLLTEKIPFSQQADYGADLLRLSRQLERSKGRPLSDERLFQLLDYHLTSFISNAQAQSSANSAGLASSMSKLVLAGGAFLIFVLVLFSFLFVKIERNLRPQQVSAEPLDWSE